MSSGHQKKLRQRIFKARKQVSKVFEDFVQNNDGLVDKSCFLTGVKTLGIDINDAEIGKLIDNASTGDENRKLVDYSHFLDSLQVKEVAKPKKPSRLKPFRPDDDFVAGKVSYKDLRVDRPVLQHNLTKLGLPSNEIADIMGKVTFEDDGKVSLNATMKKYFGYIPLGEEFQPIRSGVCAKARPKDTENLLNPEPLEVTAPPREERETIIDVTVGAKHEKGIKHDIFTKLEGDLEGISSTFESVTSAQDLNRKLSDLNINYNEAEVAELFQAGRTQKGFNSKRFANKIFDITKPKNVARVKPVRDSKSFVSHALDVEKDMAKAEEEHVPVKHPSNLITKANLIESLKGKMRMNKKQEKYIVKSFDKFIQQSGSTKVPVNEFLDYLSAKQKKRSGTQSKNNVMDPDVIKKNDIRARISEKFQQKGDFRKVFRNMDNEHIGALSVEKLEKGLYDIGMRLTPDEFQHICSIVNPNNSGTIAYASLLHYVQHSGRTLDGPELASKSVYSTDSIETRKINMIKDSVANQLRRKCSSATETFLRMSRDYNGYISFDEFLTGLKTMGVHVSEDDKMLLKGNIGKEREDRITVSDLSLLLNSPVKGIRNLTDDNRDTIKLDNGKRILNTAVSESHIMDFLNDSPIKPVDLSKQHPAHYHLYATAEEADLPGARYVAKKGMRSKFRTRSVPRFDHHIDTVNPLNIDEGYVPKEYHKFSAEEGKHIKKEFSKLSHGNKAFLRHQFKKIDKDRDGHISGAEFTKLMGDLGITPRTVKDRYLFSGRRHERVSAAKKIVGDDKVTKDGYVDYNRFVDSLPDTVIPKTPSVSEKFFPTEELKIPVTPQLHIEQPWRRQLVSTCPLPGNSPLANRVVDNEKVIAYMKKRRNKVKRRSLSTQRDYNIIAPEPIIQKKRAQSTCQVKELLSSDIHVDPKRLKHSLRTHNMKGQKADRCRSVPNTRTLRNPKDVSRSEQKLARKVNRQTENNPRRLRDQFQKRDTDSTGSLPLDQFALAMHSSNVHLDNKEMSTLYKQHQKEGKVEYNKFIDTMIETNVVHQNKQPVVKRAENLNFTDSRSVLNLDKYNREEVKLVESRRRITPKISEEIRRPVKRSYNNQNTHEKIFSTKHEKPKGKAVGVYNPDYQRSQSVPAHTTRQTPRRRYTNQQTYNPLTESNTPAPPYTPMRRQFHHSHSRIFG
ncbi:hypothetical protein PCE1_003494 [Barthelona sp. PCE]